MLTIEDVRAARERIRPYVWETPLIRLAALDEALGCRVYVKAECMQRTGAFKLRGALNKLLQLSPEQLRCGVVTASSGNHGKGLAYGARMLGVKAAVVLPDTTPEMKRAGIRALGAEITLSTVAERFEAAARISSERGMLFVHPFDDPDVIAGQGTAGLELLSQLPDADALVAPVSGGGLLAGLSLALKACAPHVRVYGAEPAVLPRYAESLRAGRPTRIASRPTLADALPAVCPGEHPFPIIRRYADGVAGASEASILRAWRMLLTAGRVLAEPSAVAGMAAVLDKTLTFQPDERVVFLLSGGNVGAEQIERLLRENA